MRGYYFALSVFFCALAASGCRTVGFGTAGFPKLGQSCNLPPEQKYSLWEPIQTLPMTVYVDERLKHARGAIENAIDTWNAFGEMSLKKKFFVLSNESLPPVDLSVFTVPRSFCAAYNSDHNGGLFIASDPSEEHWRRMVRGAEGNLAATGRCFEGRLGGTEIPATAAIVINTWASPTNMLETEVLHELGHVLGLDHSCRLSDGRYGHVKCAELPIGHPFREAVMAPRIQTSETTYRGITSVGGIAHEHLEANDMERAYCLYANPR